MKSAMNKKSIAAAAAIVCVLALAGGSLAAFTATGTATNAVSASNVEIALVILEDDGSGATQEVSGSAAIMPGEEASRIVSVKNTGAQTAWVRVKADAEIAGETITAADNPYVRLEGLNADDWTWDDGYWYYNDPVESSQTTESLFTGVAFDLGIDNDLSNEALTLAIDAQATQTEHNGSTALEAQGW